MRQNPNISDYWINILFFAIGMFFANLWLNHHFPDSSLPKIILNGAIAIYGIAASIASRAFDEEAKNFIASKTKTLFLKLIHPVFILCLYLVLIFTASVYNSVGILNNSPESSIELNIHRVGEQETKNEVMIINQGEMVSKGFFISPFGSLVTIRSAGYRDHTFSLYPLAAKTLLLDEVLVPMPSLWVRVIPTLVNSLLDQCELTIRSEAGDTIFLEETKNGFGSYTIGRPMNVSPDQIEGWQREAAAYYETGESVELSKTILKWSNIKHFSEHLNIRMNASYEAILMRKSDRMILASASFVPTKNETTINILLKQTQPNGL